MKSFSLFTVLMLAGVTGGLVVTNPGFEAYERYAREQSENYLTTELCAELPDGIGNLMADQCAEMVQSVQPEVQRLIRDRTQRMNLGVVSIYRTTLSIPGLPILPSYQIETLGIFGHFITYRVTQVK